MNAAANRSRLALLLVLMAAISLWRALALSQSGLNLYVDEAQYWYWAQHLDWGYYSKPPVIAAIIAGTTAVCGDGELCIKSGSLLLYPLTTLVLYALATRLYDRRVAFWSALVFFTLPGIAFSTLIISTDVALFLWWALASYGLWRALESDEWRWWLLVGLAAGLGLLTKYTMGIFALSAVLVLLTSPQHRRHLANPKAYVAGLLAAALFAPNLVWNAQHGWPTFHHTAEISHLETDAGLHWDELGEFLSGQAAILGPLLLIAYAALVLRPQRWILDARARFLAFCSLPFLLVICAQALLGRANANWGAMAYATGTLWLVAALLKDGRRGWLIASLVLHLAVAALAYHYQTLVQARGATLVARAKPAACVRALVQGQGECPDFYKRVQGWDRFGAQVQTALAQHPGAGLLTDERDLISQLAYYARPEGLTAVMWNPTRRVESHYDLVTTLDDKRGRDFLFVSRKAELPAGMRERFEDVVPAGNLGVGVIPGWRIEGHAWWLQSYQGEPKG